MRVLQPRRRLDLTEETIAAECGREVRVQNLDGDVAIVLDVSREVHCRHAPHSELALDAVAACQCGVELIREVHGLSGVGECPNIGLCAEIGYRVTLSSLTAIPKCCVILV